MSPAPLPYFLLHDVGKQHRGELTVTCDYTDNRKCYVGGGRGREEVKFSAPGLPAAPGCSCRHEVQVLFLVMLEHHLQSSKVGVKNLLSLSISSWLSSV